MEGLELQKKFRQLFSRESCSWIAKSRRYEAGDEMRMLTAERRKEEAKGLRVSDVAGECVGRSPTL